VVVRLGSGGPVGAKSLNGSVGRLLQSPLPAARVDLAQELLSRIPLNDLRVLIVAEDPLARAGLAVLLADQPGCLVVGQVASGAAEEDNLDAYRPDVLLWDLGWDPTAALERLSELAAPLPRLVVLLNDQAHAAEAWAAGARGLLSRDSSAESLRAALLAVAEGLAVVDPEWAAALLPTGGETPVSPLGELTRREGEVLQLLAEGLANKAIASRLSISEHTVKFHVNAIMGKLGAQSRTDAVVRGTRAGFIFL